MAELEPLQQPEQIDEHQAVAEAVSHLPALGYNTSRYGPRGLTLLWLVDATPNTRRAYYADLALWLTWCENHNVDPLLGRRADVDAWKASLTGSRRTIARRLAGVSSWYRYLVTNDCTDSNPAAAVRRPKVHRDQSPTRAVVETDVTRLIATAENRARRLDSEPAWRAVAVLRVMFTTALRVGGIISPQITDLGHDHGHRILGFVNKGGHQHRAALPEQTADAIDRYLEHRASRRNCAVNELTGNLFVTRKDKPLRQRDVWNLIRATAKDAGLPYADQLSPHSGRKTTATVALRRGATLSDVQAMLGHADPRTTQLYNADFGNLDNSPAYLVAQTITEEGEST